MKSRDDVTKVRGGVTKASCVSGPEPLGARPSLFGGGRKSIARATYAATGSRRRNERASRAAAVPQPCARALFALLSVALFAAAKHKRRLSAAYQRLDWRGRRGSYSYNLRRLSKLFTIREPP